MRELMLLLVLSPLAHADQKANPTVDAILGVEPEAFVARQPAAMQEQRIEETLRAPGITLEASPAYLLKNYQLMGSGLTAQVPAIHSLGGVFRIGGAGWHLTGGIQSATASLPSTVTPSSISMVNWNVAAGFRVLQGAGQELRLGYEAFARNSTSTEPEVLITSFLAHGPSLALSPIMGWSIGRWNLAYTLTASVPWFYAETGSLSGTYRFGVRSGLKILATTKVLNGLEVGLGLEALVQALLFSGTGSRGTVNATDLEMAAGIPLVVRYAF